MNPKNAFPPKP